MNCHRVKLKSLLTMITIVLAPFALILVNTSIVDSVVPSAYAQTWAEPASTWMNVTGGPGVPNWIFRVGYYPSPFTVNIEVSGVNDLVFWEFKLSWNASLLDVTSVTEGSFLSDGVPDTTVFYSEAFQDQDGIDYVLANCTLLQAPGKSGSGVMAVVDFDVDASATAGSTSLDLYETKLRDRHIAIISHGITDGFVFMGDHNMYPLVYVLPQTVIADPGEMFNVTVWIDNVESLQAWGFNLYWTNALLEATNIVNHVFLTGDSFGFEGLDNGAMSKAWATQVLAGPQEGTYGSGPLATITFMVERGGTSNLNLVVTDNDLIGIVYDPPNSFTYPIPHAVLDGFFQSNVSAPHAYFTFSPLYPRANDTITFNASNSFDSDGNIVAYSWNFGDGTTRTLADPIVTHEYVTGGFYLVSLTVTDNDGLQDTIFDDLAVEPWLYPPHANFDYWPQSPSINETIIFDASLSYDPDGSIVSYSWDFGDGTTQTLQNPITMHVYVMNGTYVVSLTVTDNDGLEDTSMDTLQLGPRPIAILRYSPPSPRVNETVTFYAYLSYDPDGNIVSYFWDFGDGTSEELAEPIVTHIYAMEGTYVVSLTVTDNDGLTDTTSDSLVVEPSQPSPPDAYISYWPYSPRPNQTVTFDASGSYDPDGFIVSYSWDFGDGTTIINGTSPVKTHAYSQHGTYQVTLTVVDNDGLSDRALTYVITAAEIYVYPSTVETSPGDVFRIDIKIQDVRDLFAWQVSLSWDASVLDFVNVTEGNFLKGIEDNPTMFFYKNYEDHMGNDSITIGCTRTGYVLGEDGSGLLASVLFRTTGSGATILDLYDTALADSRTTPFAIDHYSTDGYVISQGTPTHDVAITYVAVYPRETTPGRLVQIDAEVQNQGTAGETFNVTAYYGDQIIGAARVWFLPRGAYQLVEFYWDTTGVAEGTYTIRLEAEVVPGETDTLDNTYVDGVVTIVVPKITIDPPSGPVGTKVTVHGYGLPTYYGLYLTFDDQLIGLINSNETGEITAVFNVPLSEIGNHVVKLMVSYYQYPMILEAPFTVTDVAQLDVSMDVGAIYFKGETIECYIQTALRGTAIDATSLTVQLRNPDGTTQTLTPDRIDTGLYKVEYKLEGKGDQTGTYTLVAEAHYNTDTTSASGTSIKTFLVKHTWERELPRMAALSIASIGLVGGMVVLWKREKKKLYL